MLMEKPKTQAELRKESFARQTKIAKDLADLALIEIDEALAEQSHLYRSWLGLPERGAPITDDDTLASPLGYLAVDKSILD